MNDLLPVPSQSREVNPHFDIPADAQLHLFEHLCLVAAALSGGQLVFRTKDGITSLIFVPGERRTVSQKNLWSRFQALIERLYELGSWAEVVNGQDAPEQYRRHGATFYRWLPALPTASVLEDWRDEMLSRQEYSIATINARLSAARKVIERASRDIANPAVKLAMQDWTKVKSAKATTVQDVEDEDIGERLSISELHALMRQPVPMPEIATLKGLRDRAILALGFGAGLRISEIVALTMKDVFARKREGAGVRVRRGKGNKARTVYLNGWNSWVLVAVRAYTDAMGLTLEEHPDAPVIQGMIRESGGYYRANGRPLSVENARAAIQLYSVTRNGSEIRVRPHDMRRTYACICVESGIPLKAVSLNLGHSSVTITERYVGNATFMKERVPKWGITLPEMEKKP